MFSVRNRLLVVSSVGERSSFCSFLIDVCQREKERQKERQKERERERERDIYICIERESDRKTQQNGVHFFVLPVVGLSA